MPTDHDQSFKNLILDDPREALAFFAPTVAARLPADAEITPVREEQLEGRRGDRFREADTPLLVRFPSGEREAIVFDVEEQTEPRTFAIEKLAHDCLDLAEPFETRRVVPVVVFLEAGGPERELGIGVEGQELLRLRYLACELARLPAERFLDSDPIVARLNLPNMAHRPEASLEVATLDGDGGLGPFSLVRGKWLGRYAQQGQTKALPNAPARWVAGRGRCSVA